MERSPRRTTKTQSGNNHRIPLKFKNVNTQGLDLNSNNRQKSDRALINPIRNNSSERPLSTRYFRTRNNSNSVPRSNSNNRMLLKNQTPSKNHSFNTSNQPKIKLQEIKEPVFDEIKCATEHIFMVKGTYINQYSINEQIIVKKFGQIHFPYEITSLAIVKVLDVESIFDDQKIPENEDRDFQFTGADNGTLKQWVIKTGELKKDWGNAHNGHTINIIKPSLNGQYIITSDRSGVLKMWSVVNQNIVKNFKQVMGDKITEVCLTPDNQMFFVSDDMGFVKQFSILNRSLIHFCGKVLRKGILAMAVSPNLKYLYIGGTEGYLKEWVLITNKISKDFKNFHDYHIKSLFVTMDSLFQLSADNAGFIKQMNIFTKDQVKTYVSNPTQSSPFLVMRLSSEGRYLFTSNNDTELTKWHFTSNEDKELIMEETYEKINEKVELKTKNISFAIY